MRTFGIVWIFCLVLSCAVRATADALDTTAVRALMEKVDRNLYPDDEIDEVSLILIHPNGQQRQWRIRQYYQRAYENGMGAILLRFVDPTDLHGTTLVSVNQPGGENNQWLYLPAFRMPQFLADSRKSDYVFGSDLTFEDFTPCILDEYDYAFVREEIFAERHAIVIRKTPTAPKLQSRVKYAYQMLWVDPDRNIFLRADFFDSIGQMYKTVTWGDFYQPDRIHWRARRVAFFSPLRPHWTQLSVEDIQLNRGLPAEFFSERNLTNIR